MIGGYTGRLLPYFKELRPRLAKSGLGINFEAYVSITLLSSILASTLGFIVTLLLGIFLLGLPVLNSILSSLGGGLMGGASVFAALYLYPSFRVDARKSRIDTELPYAISQMAVLAMAGLNPERIFRSIAEFPKSVIAEEARTIIRDLDLLGFDLISAMQAARVRSPSRQFEDFLESFIGIAKSGGELSRFMLATASNIMEGRRVQGRGLINTLSMLSETYVAMMIVMPLTMILLVSVMGLLTTTIGPYSIEMVMILVTYIGVPIMALIMLVIFDMVIPPR